MKKMISSMVLIGSLAIAGTGPIVMESGYVKIGVGTDGTFGVGGTTSPGIMYDANGTGNYGIDDYLTPGSPYEFFTLQLTNIIDGSSSESNATYSNNNHTKYATTPNMDTTISAKDANHIVEAISTTPDNRLKITQTYTLEDKSKVIIIDVRVENISADIIKNVKYGRGLDPDVDVNAYGSYITNNIRGYDGTAEGLPVFPVEDIVIAEGQKTKKVISLLYVGSLVHNTSIESSWGKVLKPSELLKGNDAGNGDFAMTLSLDLGKMSPGDSIEFKYAYILGDDLPDLGGGLPPVTPPPVVPPGDKPTPPNTQYDRNDNPNTPQSGSAPSYTFGSLFFMMLMFGFLAYRKTTTKEA